MYRYCSVMAGLDDLPGLLYSSHAARVTLSSDVDWPIYARANYINGIVFQRSEGGKLPHLQVSGPQVTRLSTDHVKAVASMEMRTVDARVHLEPETVIQCGGSDSRSWPSSDT